MNPFADTQTIAFELSNLCPHRHAKCPLSLRPTPQILPAAIVSECLEVLSKYDWRGLVAFHQYNEPMIDPRLFSLIALTRIRLPYSAIEIATSGFYLTADLARELAEFGNIRLGVTLYGSNAEWLKREIAPVIPVAFGYHELDDRMAIYNQPVTDSKQPCREPLAFITVTCAGQVGLCCFDWKRTVTFGDLREQPLDAIISSDKAQETYHQLCAGERVLDVCRRCQRARGI